MRTPAHDIDFEAMTKPRKEPPITLLECLAKAGGFPFRARTVAQGSRRTAYTEDPVPIRHIMEFTAISSEKDGIWCVSTETSVRGKYLLIDANIARWELLT